MLDSKPIRYSFISNSKVIKDPRIGSLHKLVIREFVAGRHHDRSREELWDHHLRLIDFVVKKPPSRWGRVPVDPLPVSPFRVGPHQCSCFQLEAHSPYLHVSQRKNAQVDNFCNFSHLFMKLPQTATLPIEGRVVTREQHLQNALVLALLDAASAQFGHAAAELFECIAEASLNQHDVMGSRRDIVARCVRVDDGEPVWPSGLSVKISSALGKISRYIREDKVMSDVPSARGRVD